jgi:hypothetical protein
LYIKERWLKNLTFWVFFLWLIALIIFLLKLDFKIVKIFDYDLTFSTLLLFPIFFYALYMFVKVIKQDYKNWKEKVEK